MDATCQAIIDKQRAGNKLSLEEIHILMDYCIQILDHIEELTQLSISHAQEMIEDKSLASIK